VDFRNQFYFEFTYFVPKKTQKRDYIHEIVHDLIYLRMSDLT